MFRTVFALAVFSLMLSPQSAPAGEGRASLDEAAKAQVRKAIQEYVERDVAVKDAFFVLDPRTGAPLRLTFDNVHAGVKPHEKGHLACVDFKDRAGKVYDVDIVVGKSQEGWQVNKAFLHKVDGKAVSEK